MVGVAAVAPFSVMSRAALGVEQQLIGDRSHRAPAESLTVRT
jgi:hypothetical protein